MNKETNDFLSIVTLELKKLSEHIKMYNKGTYPAFYLQLRSVLKLQEILDMHLCDVYDCIDGNVRVKTKINYGNKIIFLDVEDRRELAWYAMQRISVTGIRKEQLEQEYLCVNKQGRQLLKQVYRKMLERSSNELSLSRVYNSGYLRSLYGYFEIVYGRKTIEKVAKEYQVERYYLLNKTFKGMEIQYARNVVDQVACV